MHDRWYFVVVHFLSKKLFVCNPCTSFRQKKKYRAIFQMCGKSIFLNSVLITSIHLFRRVPSIAHMLPIYYLKIAHILPILSLYIAHTLPIQTSHHVADTWAGQWTLLDHIMHCPKTTPKLLGWKLCSLCRSTMPTDKPGTIIQSHALFPRVSYDLYCYRLQESLYSTQSETVHTTS